jgi:hypothetical protein
MRKLILALAILAGIAAPVSAANAHGCFTQTINGYTYTTCY